MEFEKATLLSFYSTYSQSVAALVGLSATFAIFRYQNLKHYFSGKVEKIYGAFEKELAVFLTEEQRTQFKDFVNHEQRATFLEPIYRGWAHHSKKDEVHQKLKGHEGDIHWFRAWNDEFNDYARIKAKMNLFRDSILRSTFVGLSCVALGLLGTLILDLESLKPYSLFWTAFSLACLMTYLFLLFRLLMESFEKPE